MPAVSFEIKDKLMLTRLICSYRTPQRLFFRAITVFTNNFSDAIELDREKLILKNTKEHKE